MSFLASIKVGILAGVNDFKYQKYLKSKTFVKDYESAKRTVAPTKKKPTSSKKK